MGEKKGVRDWILMCDCGSQLELTLPHYEKPYEGRAKHSIRQRAGWRPLGEKGGWICARCELNDINGTNPPASEEKDGKIDQ